jgi:hypothetical protein
LLVDSSHYVALHTKNPNPEIKMDRFTLVQGCVVNHVG